MASFYKDIVSVLKENGWMLHRQGKGSHEIWIHADTKNKITIPQNCKKKHMANAILKQAGLNKKF